MSAALGEYALTGALVVSFFVMMAAAIQLATGDRRFARVARWGLALAALLLTLSCVVLVRAFLKDDFSLGYVAGHSESAMAAWFKAAALWAGQEGSLLFWAWVIAVMGAVLACRLRRRDDAGAAVALGVMAAVTAFFIVIMLFAGDVGRADAEARQRQLVAAGRMDEAGAVSIPAPSNPFHPADPVPADGKGLNPLLQNIWMVAHPPFLFVGYAGCTVPFALLLGALATRRKDEGFLHESRNWMVFAWVMLTIGIMLGAWWAYEVLGWGGYWAWDPVENASLLPWYTATAALHTATMAVKRGMFKRWNAVLIAASFFLCILATWITRSGAISSVHSFGESPIGTFFMVFMVLIVLVSGLLILLNVGQLKADRPLEELFSREGMILSAAVLLVTMLLVTKIGTLLPALCALAGVPPITPKPEFYNKVILPVALLLAALMATGPILGHGRGAAERARRELLSALAAGALAAAFTGILVWLLAYGRAVDFVTLMAVAWTACAAGVTVAVITGVLLDLGAAVGARRQFDDPATASVRTFWASPRHWGAQVAHLGMASIVVGVAGSGLYSSEVIFSELGPGQTQTIAGIQATNRGVKVEPRPNHVACVAEVEVQRGGQVKMFHVEQKYYPRQPNSYANPGISQGLLQDVYVIPAGFQVADMKEVMKVTFARLQRAQQTSGLDMEKLRDLALADLRKEGPATEINEKFILAGEAIAIKVQVKPLVNWIWIGGGLMALGGLLCFVPARRARKENEDAK